MEKVIMGTRLPAKLWLDEVEDSCMSQIMDLTSLPFAFKHIAIMPDAHAGKGMPIGGVLATNGVIVPNAVGVDIGCGMCAIKTNLKAEDFSYTDLTSIMSKIRAVVPLGFDHQNKKQDQELLPQGFDFEEMPVLKNQYEACLKPPGDKLHRTCRQIGNLKGREQRELADDHPIIQIYEKRLNTINRYVKRGTLDADLAEVMKKLAKDKMLRAKSDVAYAKGAYEKEMEQVALKKEAYNK